MGLRFRKSISLGGGVRGNISKSGIGYSVGTKGARITKTARGTTRTTLSVPGTGVSYVRETGKKRKTESRTKNVSKQASTTDQYNYTSTNYRQDKKGKSNKSAFNGIKKIILWGLAVFFLSGGFVYFPSLSGILAFLIAALILPVQKWQSIVGKAIKGKVKIIVTIVLAIAMFSTLPTTPETEESASVPTDVPSMMETDLPKTNSVSFDISTSNPTIAPTQKPTHAPTAMSTSTLVPVLKKGSKGQSVVELQERLIELGYLDGDADGNFGSGTKKAVVDFQKNNNLTADGVANEQTLTVLFSDKAVYQRWVWIPTNGGTKYHSKSSCSSMDNPKRVTYREAVSLGYDSCGRCY